MSMSMITVRPAAPPISRLSRRSRLATARRGVAGADPAYLAYLLGTARCWSRSGRVP